MTRAVDGPGTDDRLERSRAETRAAFADRALIYRRVYAALGEEIGGERAAGVMGRAIRDRGREKAEKYRAAVEAGDLAEVGRLFCETSPADGSLFRPAVEACEDDELTLSMSACPLVDAWREAGATAEEIDRLCEIAAAVDFGTFEEAGLALEFEDRIGRPGAERCVLRLRFP